MWAYRHSIHSGWVKNEPQFADIFKFIFVNEMCSIRIYTPVKFVRQCPVGKKSALVHWYIYAAAGLNVLIHWGRVTHICVSKLAINGSDDDLSPGRRQAIIWTNAEILLIGPLGTTWQIAVRRLLKFIYFCSRNAFEVVVRKLGVILSRHQCVQYIPIHFTSSQTDPMTKY